MFLPRVLGSLLGICVDRPFWVRRALYGLKESPKIWADFRDRTLMSLRFRGGENTEYRLLQSEVSRSVWFVIPVDTKIEELERDGNGETP
eukprot:5148304-Amphidinium_carterae.1